MKPVIHFRRESGFSVVKVLFWLVFLGFIGINSLSVIQAFYIDRQVQDCFESVSRNMPTASEEKVRARLKKLFSIQYIDRDDLPPEFYDELQIRATGRMVEISSWYVVTIWPLGKVESVDEHGEYDPSELSGMDLLRDKLRIDLEFEPYAISPSRP